MSHNNPSYTRVFKLGTNSTLVFPFDNLIAAVSYENDKSYAILVNGVRFEVSQDNLKYIWNSLNNN